MRNKTRFLLATFLSILICIIYLNSNFSYVALTKAEQLHDNKTVHKSASVSKDEISNIRYNITRVNYKNRNIIIRYPRITRLRNEKLQKKINNIIKSTAFQVMKNYYSYQDSVNINYKITLRGKHILSVLFTGYGYSKGAPSTTNFLYTINVNLKNGKKLHLYDFVKVNKEFIEIFKKYKVKDPKNNQASVSGFNYIRKTCSDNRLMKYFNGADSICLPQTCSYLTKSSLVIIMEVPNTCGDNMEIYLKYQDIMPCLNHRNILKSILNFENGISKMEIK